LVQSGKMKWNEKGMLTNAMCHKYMEYERVAIGIQILELMNFLRRVTGRSMWKESELGETIR